ncbi:Gfo/Idh/MocA family oxidoreductase [bacterium]|nr:Gfo/Idh/MocA family oxidoreductase [bacterium]
MAGNRLRVGVVGCGYWGPNLIRNFSNLTEECEVTMVCDQDTLRLNHVKRLYPWVQTTTEFNDVVGSDQIDIVVIVTPVSTHYDMARRSLEAGKHTLVEKPMARSTEECDRLIRLAEAKGLVLMVDHTFIYSSPVRYARELIEQGALGKVQYISSRRLNLGLFQKDINVAWDLAPHDLSIIMFLLDAEPAGVNCQGSCHLNGQEDVINMSITFSNGSFATIHNSWLDPNKIREMTIVGSKKMVCYDDTQPNEKIRIYDKRVEAPPHYDTYAEFHFSYHYGDVVTPYIHQAEPLKVECQHLIECIRDGKTPLTGGRDGMKVVQILEAASLSLRHNGGHVLIDPAGNHMLERAGHALHAA